ncbi:uncharacterized protein V6R79_014428 [Siganus canaliculatus]
MKQTALQQAWRPATDPQLFSYLRACCLYAPTTRFPTKCRITIKTLIQTASKQSASFDPTLPGSMMRLRRAEINGDCAHNHREVHQKCLCLCKTTDQLSEKSLQFVSNCGKRNILNENINIFRAEQQCREYDECRTKKV